MPILSARNLSVQFKTGDGRVDAVKSLNLEISAAECLGIVGESGSGKSQAFLACMGLLAANGRASGSVRFDGREILNIPEKKINSIRGNEIGMVFQDPLTSLTPHLQIGRQLEEALQAHTEIAGAESKKVCVEWLDRVRIPEAAHRFSHFPHQLSGGMRQRVMIAISMICRPRLLIADEPTTSLDVTVQAEILDLMEAIGKSEGTAIALITHDMGVVAQMCERIVVMQKGEIVEQGSPESIFHSPGQEYTKALLDAVPHFDKPRKAAARRKTSANPVLAVQGLKVHYPFRRTRSLLGRASKLKAVDGISFSVQPGETLGIVGESGCGKSTLARSVLQLITPTAGSVSWLGQEIAGLSRAKLKPFRKELQIVFQDPTASLDPRMTLGATIGEPLSVFRPGMNSRDRRRAVLAAMEKVGLEPGLLNRYPHELSGGQNQRVGIARAMINEPRLLVCDEAVSALDVSIQRQIVDLLKNLQEEFGLAMIFISHDLAVVREIAHRILVLYLGRAVELADSDAICETPLHPYTRSLIAAIPVPDPRIPRKRPVECRRGDLNSVLDPGAALRFLPSKLESDGASYIPRFLEPLPGHFVEEFDSIHDDQRTLATGAKSDSGRKQFPR